jgi:maltose O-acetyltransferase
MASGKLYDAGKPELLRSRAAARRLTARYNATLDEHGDERRMILEELFASLRDGAWIEPPFRCDHGWNIDVGARVFMNFGCVVLDFAPVRSAGTSGWARA